MMSDEVMMNVPQKSLLGPQSLWYRHTQKIQFTLEKGKKHKN